MNSSGSDSNKGSAPQVVAIYQARSRPPYVCRVCESYFNREKFWLYHTQRHSGQGVFRCRSCPVDRHTLLELYEHETNVHGPLPVTWSDLQMNTVTALELGEEEEEESYSGDSFSTDEEDHQLELELEDAADAVAISPQEEGDEVFPNYNGNIEVEEVSLD